MRGKPFVVACIPAYNEEKAISEVCSRAKKYVDMIIVCDDGSTDKTREIIDKLGVTVKRHPKRLGKGAALKTLFDVAKDLNADIIVTLDADGAHFPEEVTYLLKPILKSNPGADVVIGSRFANHTRGNVSTLNYAGNRFFNILTYLLTGRRLTDTQSGFRAFKRKFLNDIIIHSNGYEAESEITIKAIRYGYKIVEVPIKCGKNYRASKLHSFRDGLRIFVTIIKTFLLD